jgi:hypothetical protein
MKNQYINSINLKLLNKMYNQNPTLFKAQILFNQIENEGDTSAHWMLVALKCVHNTNPSISIKELISFIEVSCPIAKETSNTRVNYV